MVDTMESDLLDMSFRRLIRRGPLALMAVIAVFAATWRFNSCTVRAS
jgi:hypothetical protein